jgi:hypothetical protein
VCRQILRRISTGSLLNFENSLNFKDDLGSLCFMIADLSAILLENYVPGRSLAQSSHLICIRLR